MVGMEELAVMEAQGAMVEMELKVAAVDREPKQETEG